VNCFREIYANTGRRLKRSIKSIEKKIIVLRNYKPVVLSKQLIVECSIIHRTNYIVVYQSKGREIHIERFKFTLNQELHLVLNSPIRIHQVIKTRLHHTKNIDLEPLKNTQHSRATPQFSKTLSKTILHSITN